MWVKLVPVALLLASSSLDMMLLSAGTVSCIPHMAGVSLCFAVFHCVLQCFNVVLLLVCSDRRWSSAYAVNSQNSFAAALKQHKHCSAFACT